jgi:hypothetical protein
MKRPLIVAVLMGLMLASCAAATDPASTIEKYIDEYNSDDIEGVMALFSEESVLVGQPNGNLDGTPVEGLTEIRDLQVRDRAAAAPDNPYTISNVEVTGTTVTWDHAWTGNSNTWCVSGQSAVVEDGVIVSWTWPIVSSYDC